MINKHKSLHIIRYLLIMIKYLCFHFEIFFNVYVFYQLGMDEYIANMWKTGNKYFTLISERCPAKWHKGNMPLMNQIRGVIGSPLNMPLIKLEVVCSCPWKKRYRGGNRVQTSFIVRYSATSYVLCPRGRKTLEGAENCDRAERHDFWPQL